MNSTPSNAEFERLCDAAIDGCASAEQLRQLEELVLASPERRKQYAKAAALHGLLCLAGSEALDHGRAAPDARPLTGDAEKNWRSWLRPAGVGALAASLLLALGLWYVSSLNRDSSFAQLESMSGCLWEESATPTRQGQRIGVGQFRLAEGIAAIRFDNGARVDLEGPAHVELVGRDRCHLHSGKLVVTVENGFKGFVVETPNGRLIDQGTSFGVSVLEDGASVVEVFDGQVDVVHRVSGESRSLREESAVRLLPTMIVDELEYAPPAAQGETDALQVTTATGRGADCWMWRNPDKGIGRGPLLLVRMAQPRFWRFDRRICLRFDLSGLSTADVERATLRLTATPSGRGFASKSPDTTFAAYGVSDDSSDAWSPDGMSWQELPGMVDDTSQAGAVRLLGRFTIPKGQQTGSFVVEGGALTELVKGDANQLVSIVVVSETEATKGTLTHAFASSRHETLRAPTLRLWFDE